MIIDLEGTLCTAFATAFTTALSDLSAPPSVYLFGDDSDADPARVEVNAEIVAYGEDPTTDMVYQQMRQCNFTAGYVCPKIESSGSDIGAVTRRLRNAIELSYRNDSDVFAALAGTGLTVAGTPRQMSMQRQELDAGDYPLLSVVMIYQFPVYYVH